MKKITLLAIAACAVVSLASCTKNYTCTCNTVQTSTQQGQGASSTQDAITLTKVNQETANLNCRPGVNTDVQTIATDSIGSVFGVNLGTKYPYTYTNTNATTCTLK